MLANTVAWLVVDIKNNFAYLMKDVCNHIEWFSIALDESTGVSDSAQIFFCLRRKQWMQNHREVMDVHFMERWVTETKCLPKWKKSSVITSYWTWFWLTSVVLYRNFLTVCFCGNWLFIVDLTKHINGLNSKSNKL